MGQLRSFIVSNGGEIPNLICRQQYKHSPTLRKNTVSSSLPSLPSDQVSFVHLWKMLYLFEQIEGDSMFIASVLTLVLACGEKEPEDTATTQDTSADTDTDSGTVEDMCAPLEDTDGHRFDGRVEYADGKTAQGNVRVQMCRGSCYVAAWGDDGGFCFRKGTLEPGIYSFDTVPTGDGAEAYATPMAFIEITADTDVHSLEQPVVIPTFTSTQTAADGAFDAGNGLTINVDTSSFEGESISAVSIDTAEIGLPITEISGTVLGAWLLGPFDESTGSTPWSISMSGSGLNEGDQVQLYNSSYDDHAWLDAGMATVNADGVLESNEGAGIQYLTGLLIVQP